MYTLCKESLIKSPKVSFGFFYVQKPSVSAKFWGVIGKQTKGGRELNPAVS